MTDNDNRQARAQRRRVILRRGMLMLAVLTVTGLSLAPSRAFAGVPNIGGHTDKAAHFLMYGLLVVVGRWALFPHHPLRLTFVPLVLGAIGYGLLMELGQNFLTGSHRAFELGDIAANSLGALLFWSVFARCSRSRARDEAFDSQAR